nr:hypothetical protein [Tanacetum cinerariifolium]
MISLGQKNTLAEYMILSGADNRPPMLDKDLKVSINMDQFQVNTKFLNSLPPEWRDDLIACLNKAMAFLTVVASSRFHSTNNQLRTSSNTRNQATIQDDRVTVQQVQGRQGQNYSGEGHMARQCTQPKRQRNVAWYKEKAMLAEAQDAGQILDEEKLAFLADPEILAAQAQTIIPYNDAFQTEDLDTYDSDCDDLLNAQAVLMANISNYGSDVISEPGRPYLCINKLAPSVGPSTKSYSEEERVMANTTPLVTTVMKPTGNPGEANTAPRVNIQELCKEYNEDILPIIMEKARHERLKDVHARLDFEEGPYAFSTILFAFSSVFLPLPTASAFDFFGLRHASRFCEIIPCSDFRLGTSQPCG